MPCNYLQNGLGGWTEDSYLGLMTVPADSATILARRMSQDLKGKPIRLLLPIKTQEFVNDYTFSFEVRAVNTPTLGGAWSGPIVVRGLDGTVVETPQKLTLTLNESGGVVSGSGSLTGTPTGTMSVAADGTLVGMKLAAALRSGAFSVRVQGTLTGRTIVGTLDGSGFSGDSFILSRAP
jgi:hypothetical protein